MLVKSVQSTFCSSLDLNPKHPYIPLRTSENIPAVPNMSSPDTALDDVCGVTTTEELPFEFVRKRHDKYHFDMLHLEVRGLIRAAGYCADPYFNQAEQTLFKIPRMCFERSQAFWDMFSSPIPDRDQSGTSGQEGSCDDNPIVLEGIKCIDFEHFLDLLIPR